MIPQLNNLNVLIIGCPASGKTYLSNQLKLQHQDTHKFFHTDDYMKYGYKESLYALIEDVSKIQSHTKTIIEGVQGYRLLRKGVELNCYYPDIVIELSVSEEIMLKTYRSERAGKKVESIYSFNKMHDRILNDYFAMNNPRKPKWLKIENKY